MHACTIIARNYLAQARVLAESFAEHHHGSQLTVFVVDGPLDAAEDADTFTVMSHRELSGLPEEQYLAMASMYDVTELSTAVKPWVLRTLLERFADPVTYLDPDIEVFAPLDEIERLARDCHVVLTPHTTAPLPRDGKQPSEIDILASGTYNLGFVSLAPTEDVNGLLDWWSERLRTDCVIDHALGLFVDQRWFDMVPSFIPSTKILRDPGYNVAYWNLSGRELARNDTGEVTVNGEPLRFFHYSGFDPRQPHRLSRHQNRIRLADDPVLKELYDRYVEKLASVGFDTASEQPYRFDRAADGTQLSLFFRRLYRKALLDGALEPEGLFTDGGLEAFYDWLREPVDPSNANGPNRLVAEVHWGRADLQEAYPDPLGEDAEGLVGWMHIHGVEQFEVPRSLLPPMPAALAGDPRLDWADGIEAPVEHAPAEDVAASVEPWGVNVAGYLRSELGVGEAARLAISALDARAVPLMPVHGRTVPSSRQGHNYMYVPPTAAPFPVNLLCINADGLASFLREAGTGFADGRYQIGFWWWEVALFPEELQESFELVDEVWVATQHIADALSPVSSVPVIQVTLPVSLPTVAQRTRHELGLPENFLFLFLFDFHSVLERKNPLGVIDAFRRAFPNGDEDASLVIKSINAEYHPEKYDRLATAASSDPRIRIIDTYLSANDKNAMIAAADCYVSLHRSEGFGLTPAEAMYLGTPVIATGYSGNLEFMTSENSYLVDYALTSVGEGAEPYPPEGEWAEPDIEQAASFMAEVATNPAEAKRRGERAAAEIRETHSPERAGLSMEQRLTWIRRQLVTRRAGERRTGSDVRADEVLQLPDPSQTLSQVHSGPGAAGTGGRARAGARAALLRALRPYTAYQHAVNEQLANDISALAAAAREGAATVAQLQDSQAALEKNVAVAHAEALRALRERAAEATDVRRELANLQRAAAEATEVRLELANLQRAASVWYDEAREVVEVVHQIRSGPDPSTLPFESFEHESLGEVFGYDAADFRRSPATSAYLAFEDLFRGTEEAILDRQRVYVELLRDQAPVLDFGCGRGEMLDLMSEAGVEARGVDIDPGMVARCREKGHEVEEADAVSYLEKVPERSAGAIFSAQLVEHLPYDVLIRFIELSRTRLRPGGLFICETVNPHAPQALKAFWLDLTHERPVFPEVALALCGIAGFDSAFAFYPSGSGDFDHDRVRAGDYAVVARAA